MLAQIIMDEGAAGNDHAAGQFPAPADRPVRKFDAGGVPQYLEASLDAFQRNQSQLTGAVAGAFAANPLAEIARRNMEMFAAAAGGGSAAPGEEAPAASDDDQKRELAELRAQLAEMQKKLDKWAGEAARSPPSFSRMREKVGMRVFFFLKGNRPSPSHPARRPLPLPQAGEGEAAPPPHRGFDEPQRHTVALADRE